MCVFGAYIRLGQLSSYGYIGTMNTTDTYLSIKNTIVYQINKAEILYSQLLFSIVFILLYPSVSKTFSRVTRDVESKQTCRCTSITESISVFV